MSDFSITNHIQYKEHMKNFVSKKKCSELLQDLRKKCSEQLSKVQESVETLKADNAQLRSQLRALLQKCAPQPVKSTKCPITPLDQHPEYIELKKKEAEAKEQLLAEQRKANQTKLDADKCPEVISAKKKLEELRKQCLRPRHDPGSIEQHPDYPALIERHRQEISAAQSQVEAEMKKKLRTDIRNHPDYHYFKGYYESEISKLKSQLSACSNAPKPTCPKTKCPKTKCPECPKTKCPTCPKTKCPTCPECPKTKCPECPKSKPLPQALDAGRAKPIIAQSGNINVYDSQPVPFSYSHVPTINPHMRTGTDRVYYYDQMQF